MILSNKVLLAGMQRTLDEVFLPALTKPNDVFQCRIASALCEFMAAREEREAGIIDESNGDMRSTLESITALMGAGAEARCVLEPLGDGSSDAGAANREELNRRLKAALVAAWEVAPTLEGGIGGEVRKLVADCSERCVFRDYELVKSLEEFQKNLYDMG